MTQRTVSLVMLYLACSECAPERCPALPELSFWLQPSVVAVCKLPKPPHGCSNFSFIPLPLLGLTAECKLGQALCEAELGLGGLDPVFTIFCCYNSFWYSHLLKCCSRGNHAWMSLKGKQRRMPQMLGPLHLWGDQPEVWPLASDGRTLALRGHLCSESAGSFCSLSLQLCLSNKIIIHLLIKMLQ